VRCLSFGPEARFQNRANDDRLELPPIRRVAAALLLLCVACAGQMPSPITDSEVPQRKEIVRNHRVTVSLLELAPRQATPVTSATRAKAVR